MGRCSTEPASVTGYQENRILIYTGTSITWTFEVKQAGTAGAVKVVDKMRLKE